MKSEALIGKGLLQSPEEWETRNQILTNTLSKLLKDHIQMKTFRGLDLGCQAGALTNSFVESLDNLKWWGIDPAVKERHLSSKGAELLPGWAHQIPFPDSHFDCVVFANVYEHIVPEQRLTSLTEIGRVLAKGGVLVGQLPNPYFPIESHSRLPFMGWLPRRVQLIYWRLTPTPWEHDFYVVTVKDLKRKAEALGFETILVRNFNYPIEVIPRSLHWAAQLLAPVMQIIPWSWQFVFRKI